MRKKRSDETAKRLGVSVCGLVFLALVGCTYVDGLVELEDMIEKNQLKYEGAQLSEAGLKRRMKEIDDAYAEPRTPAKVNLSLETSLHSISSHNGYLALARGARACVWTAKHATTRADREQYALLGIAWGKEAVKRASTQVASYYYLALNRGVLLELRDFGISRLARSMKGNLLMARELDRSFDDCGPARALGELMVQTRRLPLYSIGTYNEGIELLDQAVKDCTTYGENYLVSAESLIVGGEFDRARALLNQLVDLPDPPDHAADHQGWLARASELMSDLPGL